MPDEGINDQLLYGALGRVSALESGEPESPQPLPIDAHQTPFSERYKPGLYGSYWQGISMSGVALPAAGSDWTPNFYDPSATLVQYQIPSTSGEFVMNGDASDARFAQVAVVCENSFTCKAKLKFTTAATSPRVQIHTNGGFSEYTASSDLTLTLRGDGQINLIKLITNFSVGDLEFRLTLWDGQTCFWIDPNAQQSADASADGSGGGGGEGGGVGSVGVGGTGPGALVFDGSGRLVSFADSSSVPTLEATQTDITETTYGSGTKIPVIKTSPDGTIITISETPVLSSTTLVGTTYNPTRSAEANLDSNITFGGAQYMQVANVVTVSGQFTADPTLAATATSFEMTLPVASNVGAVSDVAGVAFCGAIAGMGAAISGSVANNTAVVSWVSSDINSQTWSFTFSYRVI